MRVKDLVRLLNISPSYASDILKGKKGVSGENRSKILEAYPDVRFRMSNKPRYKIVSLGSDEDESPYCEVCGHCGEIECCGIRDFIEHHIKGKTNCKNEEDIISELIDLCDYKDEVFKENEKLKSIIKEAREYIEEMNVWCIEFENFGVGSKGLLEILDKGNEKE